MKTFDFYYLIVSSTATILGAIAILLNVLLWRRDKTHNAYDVFDATYLDILKMAIENPQFRNLKLTTNYKESFAENELIKYETYAFISWNFCETIFDKGNEVLMETWIVVISEENKLHRKWFDDAANRTKFKEPFRKYILQNFPNL